MAVSTGFTVGTLFLRRRDEMSDGQVFGISLFAKQFRTMKMAGGLP